MFVDNSGSYIKNFNNFAKIKELKNSINIQLKDSTPTPSNYFLRRTPSLSNDKSIFNVKNNYTSTNTPIGNTHNKRMIYDNLEKSYIANKSTLGELNISKTSAKNNYNTLIVNNTNNVNLNNFNINSYNQVQTPISNKRRLNYNLNYGKEINNQPSNINIKESYTPPPMSNYLIKNIQNKEKLMKSLKNCMSEEKIARKKHYHDREREKSLETLVTVGNNNLERKITTIKNISFENVKNANNTSVGFLEETPNNNLSRAKIQRYKLNEKLDKHISSNVSMGSPCKGESKRLHEMELNFDENLNKIKAEKIEESQKVNKKVGLLKGTFEDVIKVSNETSGILQKIFLGYNEVVSEILNEVQVMKEKKDNYELLLTKFTNLNMKYKETYKTLKLKTEEIDKLKKKVHQYSIRPVSISSPKDNQTTTEKNETQETQGDNQTSKNVNNEYLSTQHNTIINDINKKVIEDLDALYFYDKIHMRSNSINMNIPKLNLNFGGGGDDKNQKKSTKELNTNLNLNLNDNYENLSGLTKDKLRTKEQPFKILNSNASKAKFNLPLTNINQIGGAKNYLNFKDFMQQRKLNGNNGIIQKKFLTEGNYE